MNAARLVPLAILAFVLWAGVTKVMETHAHPQAPGTAATDGPATDDPEGDGAPAATAPAEPSEFLRFVDVPEERRASLDTAIVAFRDADGRRVDLVGAVHIGDAEYYDLLDRVFAGYDSVLYEMVKPKDAPVPERAEHGDSPISMVQRGMKDLLDLEFQLDAVDYRAKNFVHADLDPDTFFRLMDERGESILTLLLQAMLAEWRGGGQSEETQAMPAAMALAMMTPDRARSMKYILGRQFGDLERIAAGFEKGLNGQESVLLVERNKAALAVLRERLDAGDRRVAIFYGAAHLPDMERRLVSGFGMTRAHETWITAWDIARGPAPTESSTPTPPAASEGGDDHEHGHEAREDHEDHEDHEAGEDHDRSDR